jgi:hypothetical protein
MARHIALAAVLLGFATASPARAATLFTETFNGETPALSATLSQFAVMGSVDVVAPINPYGITVTAPASGNVLDINGTGAAGRITSIPSFSFNAGDVVTLAFDLGGSQRGGAGDDFLISLLFGTGTSYVNLSGTGLYAGLSGSGSTSLLERSLFVPGTTAFTLSSISFLAQNAGSLKFAFSSPSQDNIGPLLDNISLSVASAAPNPLASAVPELTTWAEMTFGMLFVGAFLRRRRLQQISGHRRAI